jgi:hypothetical protein
MGSKLSERQIPSNRPQKSRRPGSFSLWAPAFFPLPFGPCWTSGLAGWFDGRGEPLLAQALLVEFHRSLWHVFATARPFVCASHVTSVAVFLVISGMVSHNRQTTRLIGFRSLCSTRFQGGSVASLAFSPIRVSPLFLAFAILTVGASIADLTAPLQHERVAGSYPS